VAQVLADWCVRAKIKAALPDGAAALEEKLVYDAESD
jgi:hypothetical protein